MYPSGFFFRNMSAWGFFLFPANKKIIETLPELQLCFLLERLTNPAKHRGHWKCVRTFCCLPCYSLHNFNIPSSSLDQTTGPERQVAKDTWKPDRSRNFSFLFCSEWECQTHQPTAQHARGAAEGQAGVQTWWPFPTWFLCRESLQPPASCSGGFVCARNTCPGWVVQRSPLWGQTGFPAASLRNRGLFCLVPLWWDIHFLLYLQ